MKQKLIFTKRIYLALGLYLLSTASAFGATSAKSSEPASTSISLALNWKAEPQFGGFFAMTAIGADRKQGLNVQLIEGGSGTPTLQLLTNKKVDAAIVSGDELVSAYERENDDLVAIFATYQDNPQAIMIRESDSAKKLEDVLLDSSYQLMWQSGLPYAQYFQKKMQVKAQQVPQASGLNVFLESRQKIALQVFVTSEPLQAKKKGLNTRTFLVADAGFNPYTTVLAVRKSDLKTDLGRKRAEKLFKAVQEGWINYLKDPTEANRLMQKMNPAMDLQTFEASAKAQEPLIQKDRSKPMEKTVGMMKVERWDELIAQMQLAGLVKKKLQGRDLFLNF